MLSKSRFFVGSLMVVGIAIIFSITPKTAECSAPLPQGADIAWSHAPYEMGECGICHTGDDPADPGPVEGSVTELCYGCHEAIEQAMKQSRVAHAAVEDDCTYCHNPHNAAFRKLLIAESPKLCADCHEDVWAEATESPVRHASVESGDGCLNCHSPHASNVDSLLKGLAYDLCVDCHSEDGLLDEQGRELTGFGSLLAANPVVHGPIAARDCSGCHTPHGGQIFRLLVTRYPEKFYAPFDPKNYELCFSCHNEEVVSAERTTTLTGFRDGDQNLHFVHVNKADRGRTCRACHEVHAAPQEHLVRDGVPYGKSGWVLKINYTRAPNGGSCAKTCHGELSYDRLKSSSGGSAAGS